MCCCGSRDGEAHLRAQRAGTFILIAGSESRMATQLACDICMCVLLQAPLAAVWCYRVGTLPGKGPEWNR